jgi:hypothetical protein
MMASYEDSLSILYAPTYGIHVNKATPHKDIRITTTLNYLLKFVLAASAEAEQVGCSHMSVVAQVYEAIDEFNAGTELSNIHKHRAWSSQPPTKNQN